MKLEVKITVALAVREIFPEAQVNYFNVKLIPSTRECSHDGFDFINQFDKLDCNIKKRLELAETVVTIDVSDEVIDKLNENVNWREIVNNSELLSIKEETHV